MNISVSTWLNLILELQEQMRIITSLYFIGRWKYRPFHQNLCCTMKCFMLETERYYCSSLIM